MENYNLLLEKFKKEENELVFKNFSNNDALKIANLIIEKATKNNHRICIDITKNNTQIFHFSLPGTSADNNLWVKRKNNVVYRFNKSSYHVGILLKKAGKSIEEKYKIDSKQFSPYGGAFPIIIKNTGVIGTITVSGLKQEEDHNLVVESIKDYLKLKEN